MKVSLMMLTLNRFDLVSRWPKDSIGKIGNVETELLVCDNGSTDKRVIEYVARELRPDVHIVNEENKGVAPMWNQLMQRATGDYFVVLPNDMEVPTGWVEKMLNAHQNIENSGIVAIHSVMALPPERVVNGITIHPHQVVFSAKMWSRDVLDKIGSFCEDYPPYGLEDSDFAHRAHIAGFMNYYLGGLRAHHHGHDVGEITEYRKMKTEALQRNTAKFLANLKRYYDENEYYIPMPALDESLKLYVSE